MYLSLATWDYCTLTAHTLWYNLWSGLMCVGFYTFTLATVIMNFFVPNHDDKVWYFSTPCHFRFGIQNFPTPCVIYQDTLFDLPSEWFLMIFIYFHSPLSRHILMVF